MSIIYQLQLYEYIITHYLYIIVSYCISYTYDNVAKDKTKVSTVPSCGDSTFSSTYHPKRECAGDHDQDHPGGEPFNVRVSQDDIQMYIDKSLVLDFDATPRLDLFTQSQPCNNSAHSSDSSCTSIRNTVPIQITTFSKSVTVTKMQNQSFYWSILAICGVVRSVVI